MPTKKNALKLNPLQLRTLALLQEIARHPELSTADPASGDVHITSIPRPHGDHFHVGGQLVLAKDATGLGNPAVWAALDRKGLAHGDFPYTITLTASGADYETGVEDAIFHGSDH